MTAQTGVSMFGATDVQDFERRDLTVEIHEQANRLKQAIKRAGGNAVVAQRAGISMSTLSNYIAGRDMKVSFMIAIADACGVNIAWLAAGRGPMVGSEQAAPDRAASTSPEAQKTGVFSAMVTLDHEIMGQAIAEAAIKFNEAGKQPTSTQLATVALALYDNKSGQLTKP